MQFFKLSTVASVALLTLSCTQTVEESVNQAPTASPISVVNNDTVSFTANAQDPENDALTYLWDFGDGTTSDLENPSHTYTQDGNYSVILTVIDANDKQVVTQTNLVVEMDQVTINQPPIASPSFIVNQNNVAFSANASDPENSELTYLWTFSDNSTSTLENPTHTFNTYEAHSASLVVTDDQQNSVSSTLNFTIVNLDPLAQFSYIEDGLMVSVDASQTIDPEGDTLSYEWDFNSQSTQYGLTANYDFLSQGEKTITLTVTDSYQNVSVISKTINVSLDENLAPVAVIQSMVNDLTVVVDAINSTDPENDELSYNWNFNNEGQSNLEATSFDFTFAGDKTITLTVTDSSGNSHQVSQVVRITEAINLAPVADFEWQASDLNVSVDASTSSDPENDELTYAWNFNNEGSGDTQMASFEFTSAGEKTISLIVTDSANNQSEVLSKIININEQENASPVSYFNYTALDQDDTYVFNALAVDVDSQTLTYSWTDNAVEVGSSQNLTLTLIGDGYHTIELTVSDGNSSHSYFVQILVGDASGEIEPVNLNLDLPKEYSLINNGDILEMGGNYESDFYDDSTIEDIYIEFSDNNWASTLASNYDSETLESATLTYQGEVFSQVGVRYRGNTSYQRAGTKKSFAIELDWLIDGQDIDGYNFLKLNNAFEDPSNIREVLYNNLITDHIPSAKGSFVNVYVNGVNYGVYANVQKLDKDHVKEWFFDNDNARWRAEEPNTTDPGFHAGDSTLNNKGSSGSDYESFYTLKGTTDALDPWQNLANAAYTLGTAPQETIVDDLNPYFDIDAALWFLAVENLFTDDDGYINKGSMDYFVYLDVTTNRIMPIEFDGNSILADAHVDGEQSDVEDEVMTGPGGGGGGGQGGATTAEVWTPFHNEDDANYPLINILMANPELRQRYLAHYRTLVEESFDPATVQAKIDEYYNLIQAHVSAAEITEYSVAEFTADIAEVKSLVQRRYDYVTEYSEMAMNGVEITNVVDSVDGVQSIRPNDTQSVLVQATLNSNVAVSQAYLYYGSGLVGTFEKVTMLDSDNDGVYEATIPAFNKAEFVRYYVEVLADDAANTATYSPVGAEHDVYIYQVQAALNIGGDVVINEIMSSNKTIISDELGEYEDWVELYNNSDQDIDLSGYYLTDEDTNLTRWAFPDGSVISAHSTLTIWVDDDESSLIGLHANFKLSADGESVYLVTPSLDYADSVTFPESNDDESYARSPNGTGEFEWTVSPSYNAVNP